VSVRFTLYFETKVLTKRSYLKREWCEMAVEQPLRMQEQPDGRVRFWYRPAELGGRVIRVVTLADRVTVHNAFIDRRFKP
jgi:hypothetical protein